MISAKASYESPFIYFKKKALINIYSACKSHKSSFEIFIRNLDKNLKAVLVKSLSDPSHFVNAKDNQKEKGPN